jgi:hypothetical protein
MVISSLLTTREMAKVTIKNPANAVKSELDEVFDIEFYSYAYKPQVIREYEREIFDMIKCLGACYMRLQQLTVILTKLVDLVANIDLPWDPRFKAYSDLLINKLASYSKATMVVYYETQETRETLKQSVNAITRLEMRKHELTNQFAPVSSDSVVLLNRIFADPTYKQLAFQVNAGFIQIDDQHDRRISRYNVAYSDLVDLHRILQEIAQVYKKNPRDLTEAGQNVHVIEHIKLYLPLIERVRDDVHRLINYIKHEGYSNYLKAQSKYKQTHAIDPEFNRKLDIGGVNLLEYAILRNNMLTALDRNIEALEQEQFDRELTRDVLKGRDIAQVNVSLAAGNSAGEVTVGVNSMGNVPDDPSLTGGMIHPSMLMLDPAFSSLAINAVASDDILNANKLRLKYEHDNVQACLNRIDGDLKQCARSLSGLQRRDAEKTQEYIDLVKMTKVLESSRQSKRELLKLLNDELAAINAENYKLRKREYISEIADEVRVKREQIRDIQSQLKEMTEVLNDNFSVDLLDSADIESEGIASAARDAAMILRRTTPMDRALSGVQIPSLLSMFGGSAGKRHRKQHKNHKGSRGQHGGTRVGGHITITIKDEPDDANPFQRVTPFVVPFLNGAYTREDLKAKLDGELEDALMDYNAELEKQDLTDEVAHQLRESKRVELARKRINILKLFENLGTPAYIEEDVWNSLNLSSKISWPGQKKPKIVRVMKEGGMLTNEVEPWNPSGGNEIKSVRYCDFQEMHIREYWRAKAFEHVRMITLRSLNLISTQLKQIVTYLGKLADVIQNDEPFAQVDRDEWAKYRVDGFDHKAICKAIDKAVEEISISGQDSAHPYITTSACNAWEITDDPAFEERSKDDSGNAYTQPGTNTRKAIAEFLWKKFEDSGRGYREVKNKIINAMMRAYLMMIAAKDESYVDRMADTVASYFSSFSTKAELVLSQEPTALKALTSCRIRAITDIAKARAPVKGERSDLAYSDARIENILPEQRREARHRMTQSWEKHRFHFRIISESADLNLEYLTYICSILNRIPTDKAIAVICHLWTNNRTINYFDALIPI